MGITAFEDKLLFFLSTSLDINPIIADQEEKYAYTLKYIMGEDFSQSILDQIAFLQTSRNFVSRLPVIFCFFGKRT